MHSKKLCPIVYIARFYSISFSLDVNLILFKIIVLQKKYFYDIKFKNIYIYYK